MNQHKKELWMFHPNIRVRMLQVKPQDNGINLSADLSPSYNDIKVGILISAFGNVDNIKKIIDDLRDNYILVYDDHSDKLNDIKKLTSEKVEVYSPEKSIWHEEKKTYFDESAILYGLNWATKNKFNLLIKVDDSSNITKNDVVNLIDLAKKSDGITFSKVNDAQNFSSGVFAMYVNAWNCAYVKNLMTWYIDNEIPVIGDYWYHELAKELDYQNFSNKYNNYKRENFKGYLKSGYVDWR